MIKMKKVICAILFLLVIIINGCANSNQTVKTENKQLKIRVSQLEKDLKEKNSQLAKLQNKGFESLTINYVQNTEKKRFVEKQCNILGLPILNSLKLNGISENTVVTILDTANVDNNIWYYVSIPVYDSPTNNKGWIRDYDTVAYTKDKMKSVQSDVNVKKGALAYEGFDFSVVGSTIPYNADYPMRGRIIGKKAGYVKLSCPGGLTIWVKADSIIYPKID